MVFVVFLALCCIAVVHCRSGGLDIDVCDCKSPLYGCKPDGYPLVGPSNNRRQDRLKCDEKDTKLMAWAYQADVSDGYKMWIGDEKNPTTSYVPGQLHKLKIKTLKHNWQYRGLMCNARAGSKYVGSWELPNVDPPLFRIADICEATIMHASAETKPFLTVIDWRAPTETGLGDIKFECLLKRGNANHGYFHWPSPGEIILKESSPPAKASPWRLGDPGKSCTETCGKFQQPCNNEGTATLNSAPNLINTLSSQFVCSGPALRQCSAAGAGARSDSLCYYHDSSCTDSKPVTCDAKPPSGVRRFCACTGEAVIPPPTNPPQTSNKPVVETATTADPATCVKGSVGCACVQNALCFGLSPCANGICQPVPPASTAVAGEATATTHAGKLYYPKAVPDCEAGAKGCNCNAGQCNDNALACYDNVCVGRDCLGEKGCACNQSRCLGADLICVLLSVSSDSDICSERAMRTPTSTEEITSASARHLSLFVSVFATAVHFRTPLLLLASLLAFMPSTNAHNWINTNSRSLKASTFAPCLPRGLRPHVHVGPNQSFQAEWMTAHGNDAYFVLIKAEDEANLGGINFALLDQYISEAPEDNDSYPKDSRFWKYHWKQTNGGTALDGGSNEKPGFFKRQVQQSDAAYIMRDATSLIGAQFGDKTVYQMEYHAEAMKTDRRVAYSNPKWPWLLAVHRYLQTAGQATRPDVTNFIIPQGSPAGNYILHYVWKGYRDCIDVVYNDKNTVDKIYGVQSKKKVWQRVDHCAFKRPSYYLQNCAEAIGGDWSNCKAVCERSGICRGVIYAPAKAPPTVWPEFQGLEASPIPWGGGNGDKKMCEFSRFENATHENMVCIAIKPASGTDTEQPYRIVTDPAHPAFYSTCWTYEFDREFEGLPPPPQPKMPAFHYEDKCIACDLRSFVANRTTNPVWELSDKCVDCDLEPSAPLERDTVHTLELVKARAGCDGSEKQSVPEAYKKPENEDTCEQGYECQIDLMGFGTNKVETPYQCQYLVNLNPECSEWVMHAPAFKECSCWSKASCCKPCAQTNIYALNLYKQPAKN